MVQPPLAVAHPFASSSPSFSLSGRFILINNILCKTATNDGTFRPSQLFGNVRNGRGRVENGMDGSFSGSCASAYVVTPHESSSSTPLARVRPHESDDAYDNVHHLTNNGSTSGKDGYDSLARCAGGGSSCPSPPPMRQGCDTPPYRSPTDRHERGAAQEAFSFAPHSYSSLASPDASRREVEDGAETNDRAENKSLGSPTRFGMHRLFSPVFSHDMGEWGAAKDPAWQQRRCTSWSRSSLSIPPRTGVTVVSNPNCLVLRLFGITSGGVLLDSFGRTATDMLDTALLCPSAIQEGIRVGAEGTCLPLCHGASALPADQTSLVCSSHHTAHTPPPESVWTSQETTLVRPSAKRCRSEKMSSPSFPSSTSTVESPKGVALHTSPGTLSTSFGSRSFPHLSPSPSTQDRTPSSSKRVQSRRRKRTRKESEKKEEEAEEEEAAGGASFFPSLFSDVASCLPVSFHRSLSLGTVPARNLLLYAEGNVEDVVVEAHYGFVSSIEPLHFHGTASTPLCYPRGVSSRERSTSRCGVVTTASNRIWGRLCVLENAPLVYYLPRADAVRGGEEAQQRQRKNESTAASGGLSGMEDRHRQCEMWKRWIGALELLRWWSKALLLNDPNALGTSFQAWITPHNVYPQLAGHRVRLVLPWRIDGTHGTQNFFPIFHANECGIQRRRHTKHGARKAMSSRYSLLRAVTREFRLTRKALQKTSRPSRVHFSSSSRAPLWVEPDGQKGVLLPESMGSQEVVLRDTESPLVRSHSPASYAVGEHSQTLWSGDNEGRRWAFSSSQSVHPSVSTMERSMYTGAETRRDAKKKEKKGICFLPGGEIGMSDGPTRVRDYWLLFHRFYPSLDIEKVPLQQQRSSATHVPFGAEANARESALWISSEEEKKTTRAAQEVSCAASRSSSVGNASNNEWSSEPDVAYKFTSSKKSFSCARTIHRYYERYGKYLSVRYRSCSFPSSVSCVEDNFISNENGNNIKDSPLSSSSTVKKTNSVSESEVAAAWHYFLLNDEEALFHRLKRLSNYLVTLMEYDYGLI